MEEKQQKIDNEPKDVDKKLINKISRSLGIDNIDQKCN